MPPNDFHHGLLGRVTKALRRLAFVQEPEQAVGGGFGEGRVVRHLVLTGNEPGFCAIAC
jgi:hypothetical protein